MNILVYYRPQRSWGKVIFSQASVILSTGGVLPPGRGCFLPGGLPTGGCFLLGVLPPGALPPRGVLLPWGCFLPAGGASSQGGFLLGVPGGDPLAPGTATVAGGTHPTGMHSCWSMQQSYDLK